MTSALRNREAFVAYFNERHEHPENEVLSTIQQVFQAFQSGEKNTSIQLGDRQIAVADLTPRERDVFIKFAKSFFKTHPVQERAAWPLLNCQLPTSVKTPLLLNLQSEKIEKPNPIESRLTSEIQKEQKAAKISQEQVRTLKEKHSGPLGKALFK